MQCGGGARGGGATGDGGFPLTGFEGEPAAVLWWGEETSPGLFSDHASLHLTGRLATVPASVAMETAEPRLWVERDLNHRINRTEQNQFEQNRLEQDTSLEGDDSSRFSLPTSMAPPGGQTEGHHFSIFL